MQYRRLFPFVLCALFASLPAQASDRVAGWDFSQYCEAASLKVDCDPDVYAEFLDANYSDYDGTDGAGAESAAFGTLYMDGSYGSTDVGAGLGGEPILAYAGSLTGNLSDPGEVSFDQHAILDGEGQPYTEYMSLAANAAVSIVFGADLTSVPQGGYDWEFSFGAMTSGGTVDLDLEYSFDGINYTPFLSYVLDTTDTHYDSDLIVATLSDTFFVRMVFEDPGSEFAILDNVALRAKQSVVPEPATGLLLGLGLVGLAAGRRRHPR